MNFLKSFFAAFLLFLSGLFSHPQIAHQSPIITPTITVTVTATTTPTPSLKSTPVPTKKIVITVTPIINVQGAETDTSANSNSGMATADELFTAMNDYRRSHGLNAVNKSGTLCTIAQTRVNQQASLGHLDNHAGFVAAAQSQTEFKHVGELLQYWSEPENATYLVNTGWGQSEEHVAIMADPTLTDGCGAINGYYSVFIFGRK